MRKLIILIIILAFLLTGCLEAGELTKDVNSDLVNVTQVYPYNVAVDTKTGCEYISMYAGDATAITPRMGVDGKQICNPH